MKGSSAMIDDLKRMFEPLRFPIRNFLADTLNGGKWEHSAHQTAGCDDTGEIIAMLKRHFEARGARVVMIAEVKGDYSIPELERIAVTPSLYKRAAPEMIFRDVRLAARAAFDEMKKRKQ
jgi:hypothetical protein